MPTPEELKAAQDAADAAAAKAAKDAADAAAAAGDGDNDAAAGEKPVTFKSSKELNARLAAAERSGQKALLEKFSAYGVKTQADLDTILKANKEREQAALTDQQRLETKTRELEAEKARLQQERDDALLTAEVSGKARDAQDNATALICAEVRRVMQSQEGCTVDVALDQVRGSHPFLFQAVVEPPVQPARSGPVTKPPRPGDKNKKPLRDFSTMTAEEFAKVRREKELGRTSWEGVTRG